MRKKQKHSIQVAALVGFFSGLALAFAIYSIIQYTT